MTAAILNGMRDLRFYFFKIWLSFSLHCSNDKVSWFAFLLTPKAHTPPKGACGRSGKNRNSRQPQDEDDDEDDNDDDGCTAHAIEESGRAKHPKTKESIKAIGRPTLVQPNLQHNQKSWLPLPPFPPRRNLRWAGVLLARRLVDFGS